MRQLRVALTQIDHRPVAEVRIPPPDGLRVLEVIQRIENELGGGIYRDLDIAVIDEGTWAITLRVYPHAEIDTLNRMLLLQWATKRLVEFSPAIDITNLREIQKRVLH
ncbi:MAG: hypothetical protein K9M10_01460 [Candidatus Pacebacteria bacterium]|nr:hypothetical protein [Candidatus Paceibacterota bacterium]MCF7857131.1 hypothetical protein [Candidatus Paceibacterota bacterium]